MFHSLIQPTVLTEQLNQLHVHVRVSWPRCKLSLEEVEQLVPALLALTTQQTLLNRHQQTRGEQGSCYRARARGAAAQLRGLQSWLKHLSPLS